MYSLQNGAAPTLTKGDAPDFMDKDSLERLISKLHDSTGALVLGIISTSGERSRVYEEYLSNSNDIDFEYLRYEDTYDRWNANDIGNDVKRDPIWLAYNRAYKAHYTRYMKKKMTVSEFEEWSRQAVVWRIQAEQGKLKLTEYEILLKK